LRDKEKELLQAVAQGPKEPDHVLMPYEHRNTAQVAATLPLRQLPVYPSDLKCKRTLRKRGIKSRIARKGIESSEKLGRHRWVERTLLAWLSKYRRLTIRYERRDDIHEAFLHLGCSLICLKYLV
jgi:hypothetical protein